MWEKAGEQLAPFRGHTGGDGQPLTVVLMGASCPPSTRGIGGSQASGLGDHPKTYEKQVLDL